MELSRKREQVIERLRGLGSALVAYSGGVDSALLLALAREALGHRAIAFTAVSPAVPRDALEPARALAPDLRAAHVEKPSAAREDPDYVGNPADRCTCCRTEPVDLPPGAAPPAGLS